MKKDYCLYADPFHGNGRVALPFPSSLAATWHYIKAITGNTSPAAVLPFGKYSCCSYTGGYPTGRLDHTPNSAPWNFGRDKDCADFIGLSHFQQSGTGAIDYYYNYAVMSPFTGEWRGMTKRAIKEETAEPGYYSVSANGGIKAETSVSESGAYHVFSFPEGEDCGVTVDFSNNGLNRKWNNMYFRPEYGKIKTVSPTLLLAEVSLCGLVNYFALEIISGGSFRALFGEGELTDEKEKTYNKTQELFGAVIAVNGNRLETKLSVSLRSFDCALNELNINDGSFAAIRQNARARWNEYLSAIDIDCADEYENKRFYSNLYHSLIKPSLRPGDSPLWDERAFATDFSTMWDIYKTELPLIFTLYKKESEDIAESMLLNREKTKEFPHTHCLIKGLNAPQNQAAMLAEYSLCDAYYRNLIPDPRRMLDNISEDINRDFYKETVCGGTPRRITHKLDICDAMASVEKIADERGDKKLASRAREIASEINGCYDGETGLLFEDRDYYEGNKWNYSFRLQNDMEGRIEKAGGKEKFALLLDKFFGFSSPADKSGRFEGFNNEPDMETPYNYIFAGQHDKLCEILGCADAFSYDLGEGGLPGNNDSGGMSSCFIWNASGIFPVTGQNKMLIGTPKYRKTTFRLSNGKTFSVVKEGEGIYVRSCSLNGIKLDSFEFSVTQLMEGGVLTVLCSEERTGL